MATISVSIDGPSREAKLYWDGSRKRLSRGDDAYSAEFEAQGGKHTYAVVVAGPPGEAWSATVEGGKRKFKHAGHMSNAGTDTTGDTPYEI